MRINDQIKGKEVVDSSGMIVGKVKDVEINWNENVIEGIVLGEGGISESLGLSKNEKTIPYDMVKLIGDKILLKSGFDEPKSDAQESEDDKFQGSLDKIKNRIDIR